MTNCGSHNTCISKEVKLSLLVIEKQRQSIFFLIFFINNGGMVSNNFNVLVSN